MAIESLSQTPLRLPIKVIIPKQANERKVPSGGTPPKAFRIVDLEYRRHLIGQVTALRTSLYPVFKKIGIAPIRAQLISNATAKSHRPESLFSSDTCPIIGAGQLGELFLLATENGLNNLEKYIATENSKEAIKELSCIEKIEIVNPMFRKAGKDSKEILSHSPKRDDKFLARIRLFDTDNFENQGILIDDFIHTCESKGIIVSRSGYIFSKNLYEVECSSVSDIETLSEIVGIRSIASMPIIKLVNPDITPESNVVPFMPHRDNEESPVVVVVDSGISIKNPMLNGLIVGRESVVAPEYQNTTHGTFVAGLICYGKELNPDLPNIDNSLCKVFDLQVLPNDDPKSGPIDILSESEFLFALEGALQRYANDYKVWNISLNTNEICSLYEFSPLAEELDNLQEMYRVSFVISAGNYETVPLLDYPRNNAQIECGRITSPADSTLSITVGAISHLNLSPNGPDIHQPSAFSRHGPGPNYVIKPDLVHFGGSCSRNLDYIHGIHSLTEKGVGDSLGTSFSTPLVSRTLAQIYHKVTPTPSPVLAKALLIHHARDPRTNMRVPDDDENFFGFGMPEAIPYCLSCSPYSSTLVFDDIIRPKYYLEWDDFPYPPSLHRAGKYYGEISMTLAFSPTRGARWGTEYCETHIDVHFGVYQKKKNLATGSESLKFKGLVPPEHKSTMDLHEKTQVEKLRKWAPLRTYYVNMGDDGVKGERWRLKLQLLTRHEIRYSPQPFSLIITISDPEHKAPVYDEMAQIVRNRFKAENLNLRSEVRVQTKV